MFFPVGDDSHDFEESSEIVDINSEDIQVASAQEPAEGAAEEGSEPRATRPNFLTPVRFADFDLPVELMDGLDSAGFEYCTPIQAQSIPEALAGHDIAGQAQTGTGKTTAFLVPMIYRLMTSLPLKNDVPRALIITPTRELAQQIYDDVLVLARHTGFKSVLIIGGMEYKEQADILATAPEIVICTPGRVMDYIRQGIFKTGGVEVAVVDEADRLLDMGFIKDLKYILGKLPSFTERQTMLFSATLDQRVLELTYEYMNPPQFITAEPDKASKIKIEQELYHIGRDEKLSLLLGLLRKEEHQRVMIFSNTKSGVEWLAKKLTLNGFPAEGITGDLPQPKRLKLMDSFKENRLQILVATDVASRGIHVDEISHVYNYDLPQDAENYVHRIGRTARAGKSGKAISFSCEDYVFHLEAIENLLGEKIPVLWPGAELFAEDKAGDVVLHSRDRRDKKYNKSAPARAISSRGGREEGRETGSRMGPARVDIPGGIFGLAPRLPLLGEKNQERGVQTLSWRLNSSAIDDSELILNVEAILSSQDDKANSDGQHADAMAALKETHEGKDGRRRRKKRRSNKSRTEGERPLEVEDVQAIVHESQELPVAAPVLAVETSEDVGSQTSAQPLETGEFKRSRSNHRRHRSSAKAVHHQEQAGTASLDGSASSVSTPEVKDDSVQKIPEAVTPLNVAAEDKKVASPAAKSTKKAASTKSKTEKAKSDVAAEVAKEVPAAKKEEKTSNKKPVTTKSAALKDEKLPKETAKEQKTETKPKSSSRQTIRKTAPKGDKSVEALTTEASADKTEKKPLKTTVKVPAASKVKKTVAKTDAANIDATTKPVKKSASKKAETLPTDENKKVSRPKKAASKETETEKKSPAKTSSGRRTKKESENKTEDGQ